MALATSSMALQRYENTGLQQTPNTASFIGKDTTFGWKMPKYQGCLWHRAAEMDRADALMIMVCYETTTKPLCMNLLVHRYHN